MIARQNGYRYDCIAVDLNTQRDFCAPDGLRPVRNLETLIPALRKLVAWVKRNGAPVISAMDAHRPSEIQAARPLCCLDGSAGQEKLDFTIFPSRTGIESDNTLCVPLDLLRSYQQLIFRKRTNDLLHNPKADRLLTQVLTEEFIVFGNTLECSVKVLTLGLLARAKRVSVVVDACGFWNRAEADLALRQMQAKGARFLTVCELRMRKLTHRNRYRRKVARRSARLALSRSQTSRRSTRSTSRSISKANGRASQGESVA